MVEVNLVLSGGGARGIAHLGVVKRMLELDIAIHAISGVSAGAIAGAFLSMGMLPDEILKVAINNADFHIRRPPFTLGFFSRNNLEKALVKYFPVDSFHALSIPLYVGAANINTGVTEFFSSGEIIRPLIASASIPLIFPAVDIDGSQYLDGGLLNNLPVEPFLGNEYPIVGVHVNPIAKHERYQYNFQIIERTIELAINKNIRTRKQECTLYLEPPEMKKFTSYDFSKAEEMFSIGYDYAKEPLLKFIEQENKQQNKS
jgi:NTE family protein